MRRPERFARLSAVLGAFILAGFLAHQFGAGGLWHGFDTALAVAKPGQDRKYDLTRLEAVNETLKYVRDRYVDPDRVRPKDMLLSALNYIQRDVAQVIVLPTEDGQVLIRADTHEKKIAVDDVLGPWDVAAKLREVFGFLQKHLANTEVDLRNIEYAACNGILRTLDPHSTFLSPEAYKEMNLSTSGHFGGLGIVISIRDQVLTIIRPMPGTPAGRAGLKRFDRVMKINNESTLNMPLDDAVRRLRGQAGTKVTVWIQRKGEWEGLRAFELTRERIRVDSVISKRLDDGIGYIRLKQFQATSTSEMKDALSKLREEGELSGLVLDLRGNPGGLLEQAAKVTDLFVERGTLVATVGHSEGREEKRASAVDTEPQYPLVVLVNGSSASASEIVAGALRNLDRAVIVGETTFGKGSVQLVFPDITPDKAALKLTIAQYLTPGDKSIQGVGVAPHIELDSMTPDRLEMDLTLQDSGVRERDLSQHLDNERATKPTKPAQVVRYFLSQKQRQIMRERGGELDDVFSMDFPIEFAQQLAAKLPKGKPASQQVRDAGGFIEQVRNREIGKVAKELEGLGIDWSVPNARPSEGPSSDELKVTVTTDKPGHQVKAGDSLHLEVKVENTSDKPVYRLRATTQSDNPYYDEKELVFGQIEPGASRVATTPLSWCEVEGHDASSTKPTPADAKRICNIPKDALARSDGVKIVFDAAGGFTPPAAEVRPTIVALERPLFQYSYQVADDVEGNGDGLLQKGERVTMYLTVKNVGKGRSFETQANLANRSGDGVLLRKGRFDISNMKPGDVRKVAFTFDVLKQLKEPEVVLSLSVGDRDLREFASEKVRLPLDEAVHVKADSGTVETTKAARLFGDAKTSRPAFGSVAAGTIFERVGSTDDAVKVKLDEDRVAFLRKDVVKDGGASGGGEVEADIIYGHAPPVLTVKAASMATRDDKVKIDVSAFDSERLLDMYVFVGQRKFYYQSNRDGSDPHRAKFSFDVPLHLGVNMISVVARESPDTTTRRVVVVRRDGANGSIQKTPKHQEDFLIEALGNGN